MASRPLAIVTGASTGIGYELAKCCAENGFDLVVAADESRIAEAAAALRGLGADVTSVKADLATLEGVDKLCAAAAALNRPAARAITERRQLRYSRSYDPSF